MDKLTAILLCAVVAGACVALVRYRKKPTPPAGLGEHCRVIRVGGLYVCRTCGDDFTTFAMRCGATCQYEGRP